MDKEFFNSKKGISIMVGYVLLITFAIIIGVIVAQWIRTYVPKEALACPDGVSIFVDEISCNLGLLNLTIRNNGRFSIAGYFIHATDTSEQELATIDLSQYISGGGSHLANAIVFQWNENSMDPNEERMSTFNLPSNIDSIEMIPVRFQEQDGKKRFVSCGNSKIKEKINCVGSFFCGDGTCNPGETCLCVDCDPCSDVCGDGTAEFPEQCDGEDLNGATCASVMGVDWIGNLSCKGDCTFDTSECIFPKRIIFVSSRTYQVGDFGSIGGADAICDNSANLAGLSGGFKAWLSDSSQNARDLILPDEEILFYRTDNVKIAENAADLLDGTIQNQINRNEYGTINGTSVWTGTDEFGYAVAGQNCEDWAKSNKKSTIGDSNEKDSQWTNDLSDANCGLLRSIYCIQIS